MSLDIAALAEKYDGEIVAGGVIATVNGKRDWVAKLINGAVMLTPLGVELESVPAEEPAVAPIEKKKSKKGIAKPVDDLDAVAAALEE